MTPPRPDLRPYGNATLISCRDVVRLWVDNDQVPEELKQTERFLLRCLEEELAHRSVEDDA